MSIHLKISHKLFFSFLLILFVSYATLIFTTVRSIDLSLQERINRELAENLKYAKNQYLARGNQMRYALEYPASSPFVQERLLKKDSKWFRQTIKRWASILPFIDVLMVVDANNRVLARFNSERSGETLEIGHALEQAYRQRQPVTSTEIVPNEFLCKEGMATFCAATPLHDAMMVTVVIPLIDDNGAILGAILAGDVINRDYNIPYQVQEIFGKEVIVSVTQWGRRISTNLRDDSSAEETIPDEILGRLKQGQTYVGRARIGKKQFKSAFEPISNGKGEFIGSISVAVSEADFKRMLEDSLKNIMLSASVGIMLTFVIAFYAARRLTRPIDALADGVRRIEAGDLSNRVMVTSSDEHGLLADSFNRMARSLEERDRIISSKTLDLQDLNQRLQELNELLEKKVVERTSELLMGKERLEAILTSMAEGVIVTDRDDRVILFNTAAQRLFDTVPPRVLGQNIETVCARWGGDQLMESIQGMRDWSGAREEDLKTLGKKLKVNLCQLKDDQGGFAGVVMSIRDVTIEEEVDRMKTEFISTVSHELKTPLTSMKGSLQYLLNRDECLGETERELLQICSRNTERLIRLIGDILDISKIESGRMELRLHPQSIREIVTSSIEEIGGFARERDITIINRISDSIPPVYGDHDRIMQVVTNLLSNAVKFSPEGRTVTVSATRIDCSVAVSVADQGREILWADRAKLFRKFQQLDGSDRRQYCGTGLGLAICKEIVEKHHGRIYYEGGSEGGNVFTFTLPMVGEEL